jgi:hypothetical protein
MRAPNKERYTRPFSLEGVLSLSLEAAGWENALVTAARLTLNVSQ